MMSPSTIELFELLLSKVQLSAASANFEAEALQIATARKELAEARVSLDEGRGPV